MGDWSRSSPIVSRPWTLIWHAGDWQEEAVLDGVRGLGKPLEVVNGNAPDDPRFPMTVRRRLAGLENERSAS